MPTLAVADALDDATRAEVEALLHEVEAATGHAPLADAKLVQLHARAGEAAAFTVLARDGTTLTGVAVGMPAPGGGTDAWNVQEAVTAGGSREALAREALDEASGRGARRVQWWAVQATGDDDALAARLGLAPWRDVVQMRRPLPHREVPRWPEGVALRSFLPGQDDAAWLEVNRRAFATHPEQRAFDQAELAGRMAEPWFEAADFLVAEDGQGLAGFCWVKVPDATHGEIYVIGVDPRRQGSGLGRALTLAGLARMVERGVPEARLYVDGGNAAGLALYDSLGFSRHHVDRAYAADARR